MRSLIQYTCMWCQHTESSMDVSLHTMGFPERLLLSSYFCRCKQHFLYCGLCKSYMTALHRWCEHIVPNTYLYCRVYVQAYNQRIYNHTKTYFGSSPSIVKQPSGAVMSLCDTDDAVILQHIMQYPFHIAHVYSRVVVGAGLSNTHINTKMAELYHFISPNPTPSAAYMRQWNGSSLVQVMACCLFGAKP